MRKSSYDKSNNAKQRLTSNVLTTNTSYVLTSNSNNLKNVNQKYSSSFQSCYENLQDKNYLQRSISADNVIRSRGFKPSDRHDPVKRNFLENLTSKILHFDMESGERTPMNLQKLLTPASDSQEPLHAKNKKMFASSYFYAPTHPTVEDQVELARRISLSLSDVKNMKSKGQSMYVNRKKRSVKWIHDGNGTEGEEEPSSPMHKDKVPLKCVMNPHGKVLDIHGIQALGEEVNIEPMPSHPEKLFDIVRDLNNQRGRGAEIFAKRRKRSEKWVVDQDQVKTPSTPGVTKIPSYPYQPEMNGNSKYSTLQSPYQQTDKSFYNPFAVDLSLDNINPPVMGRSHHNNNNNNHHHHHHHHQQQQQQQQYRHRSCQLTNDCNHSTQIKKIYLREVAVGTDTDFPTIENKYESNKKKDVVARRGNGFLSNGVKSNNNNNNNNNNKVVNNVERRFNKLLGNKTNSNNATQISNTNNKEMKIIINNNDNNNNNNSSNSNSNKNKNKNNRETIIKQRLSNNFSQDNFINDRTNKLWNKSQTIKQDQHDIERLSDSDDDDAAANEYTPVPVKQLIQEFEKTCRPVLQYKQISPKVIPIVQQCPIDTDIARFFQTRTNVKYNEQVPRDEVEEEDDDDDDDDEDDDDDDEEDDDEMEEKYIRRRMNRETRREKQDVINKQPPPAHRQLRIDNGYLSTDETEYTSDSDSLRTYDYKDYNKDETSMYRYEQITSNLNVNGNGSTIIDQYSSNIINDEYSQKRRRSATSQELESYCNGNVKFVNEDSVLPAQAKSFLLSMVASQDDILKQIKHLRNTPVLDNLLPGGVVTPEPKFTDSCPEVGTKLYEDNDTYKGPKLASIHNLTNYNTAPRGWDQSLTYYRPIKFEKSQDTIVYSDF